MIRILFVCVGVFALVAFVPSMVSTSGTVVQAAGQVSDVMRGNPLRRILLDAARPIFVADTRGDVQFVVRRLKRWGPWAYARVLPQRPSGQKIDWSRTPYAEIHAAGDLDGGGESDVLLIRQGDGWVVHEYAIGPTDAVWDGWRQVYQLPMRLFTD